MGGRAALFDELTKIGEEASPAPAPDKDRWKRALKASVVTGLGIAAGTTAAEGLGRLLAKRAPSPQFLKAMHIILPTLGGATVVLGRELAKQREKYVNTPSTDHTEHSDVG